MYYKLPLLYYELELQFVNEIVTECYFEVKSTSCFLFLQTIEWVFSPHNTYHRKVFCKRIFLENG